MYSQEIRSRIVGKVSDADLNFPLVGATIEIKNDQASWSMVTDGEGRFQSHPISIGRYEVTASYLGYSESKQVDVHVKSGKQKFLEIKLQPDFVELQAVNVKADQGKVRNELAISGRQFNTEEARRYAGSRADPARMASNFAGVQGANDARNDIIVRGNSPTGLLWRIEGVDVFNPNHFAVAGTNGGPVTMLNNKVLANSDFLMGAFPAEFGNATSGVFDIQFRSGNVSEHEFTGQFGVIGTELIAEGPIKRDTSSFLVAYRYSTLDVFHRLNIPIGTASVPKYQDVSFKLDFKLGENTRLNAFGIGGVSNNDLLVSEFTEPQEELYGQRDRDQYFFTDMGMAGISLKHLINKKTHFKMTLASSGQSIRSHQDLVFRPSYISGQTWEVDSLVPKLNYNFISYRHSANAKLTYRPKTSDLFQIGWSADLLKYNFFDSLYNESTYQFEQRIDVNEFASNIQPYVQWKHVFNPRWQMVAGLRYQYISLSSSSRVEPRLGLNYNASESDLISFGYGRHSRQQPVYFHFQEFYDADNQRGMHNRNMDVTNAHHLVLSWLREFNGKSHLKVETYYQYLSNIPVAADSTPFSLANYGSTFTQMEPGDLVNAGTSRNYGVEITYDRYFSKTFFLLTTLSVFQSEYQALDQIWRSTAFNGNYIYNLLGGKRFVFGRQNNKSLEIGGKITLAGGRRYTPLDMEESDAQNLAVYDFSRTNAFKMKDYFRLDTKISYQVDLKKYTHVIAVDLVNVTNQENFHNVSYVGNLNGTGGEMVYERQLGFLPLFYYQVLF